MQKLVLFLWMLITLTSVYTPEVYAISSVKQEKSISFDQANGQEQNGDEQKQVNLQIDRTIANTLQIGFHADLSFEFELPLVLDNSPEKTRTTSIESSDHFKTLFYFIISPNAP